MSTHTCDWACYVDKYGVDHHSHGVTPPPQTHARPKPSDSEADRG